MVFVVFCWQYITESRVLSRVACASTTQPAHRCPSESCSGDGTVQGTASPVEPFQQQAATMRLPSVVVYGVLLVVSALLLQRDQYVTRCLVQLLCPVLLRLAPLSLLWLCRRAARLSSREHRFPHACLHHRNPHPLELGRGEGVLGSRPPAEPAT